ncbi:MAG: DUF6069 family protein [Actinomycetes bacterium]
MNERKLMPFTTMQALSRAVLIAMGANAFIYFIAKALSGNLISTVATPHQPITLIQVVGATVVQGFIGGTFLAWVASKTAKPRQYWTIVAALLLVASFFMPLSSTERIIEALWLCLMHCTTGYFVITAGIKNLPAIRAPK